MHLAKNRVFFCANQTLKRLFGAAFHREGIFLKMRKRGAYSVGQNTRAAVIAAAAEIVSTVGYHGLSLRDLASKVGISHGTVVYHFPNKEALIRALVVYWETELGFVSCSIDEENTTLTLHEMRLTTYNDILLRLMELTKIPNARDILRLTSIFIAEGASPSHPAHEYMVKRHKLFIQHLTETAEEGRAAGIFHYDGSTRELANTVAALWYGQTLAARYAETSDDVANMISGFLAACLYHSGLSSAAVMQLSENVPNSMGDVYLKMMRQLSSTFISPID